MALTKMSTSVANVAGLADQVRGQASTVKATFDKAGTDIKTFINATLTAEVDALDSAQTLALNTHKTSTDHDGRYYTETELNAGQLNNLYYTETEADALFATQADIVGITLGAIPNNSLTEAKMANEMKKMVGGVSSFNSVMNLKRKIRMGVR